MRILNWDELARIPQQGMGRNLSAEKTALTIGVFDGIHRGHRLLIEKIIQKYPELVPTVITFTQNPKEFLKRHEWKGDILSLNQKLTIFEGLGVGMVILIDFSEKFSKIIGKEFFEQLLRRLNPGFIAVGSNFRCGYRSDTDAAQLKAFFREKGIRVEVVPPVNEGVHPVSSSRVRAAIAAGELQHAAELLGRKVAVDLSDAGAESREGAWFFKTLSQRRLFPPPGDYPVRLYFTASVIPPLKAEDTGMPGRVLVMTDGILVSPLGGGKKPFQIEFL
jgi:riboflavin kinase/FMN adenylyltransferase